MTQKDPYAGLASRYDRMRRESPERMAFFRRIFGEYQIQTLLDCACGTGQDLASFSEMGLTCSGSDLSEAMLAQARRTLSSEGLDLPLVQADFRRLPEHFAEPFDGVVCLSNSINELLTDTETLAAIRSMSRVLRPGGLLVLDQGQTDQSISSPQRFIPIVNDRDFTRIFEIEIDYDREIQTVRILDAVHTAQTREFHTSCVRLRIRLEHGWRSILAEAGMMDIRVLGGWHGDDYDPGTSQRLIVTCRSPWDSDAA